jgi:hypothetical protein
MVKRSNSNNSSRSRGSDQSMMSGWADTAKDRPMATAAAAAGAVAAGVFLWSKRNQITDQISRLSDQVADWAEDMRSGNSRRELAMTEGPNESGAIESSRSTGSRAGRSTGTRSRGTTARSTGGQSRTAGQNMTAGQTEAVTH